MNINKMYMSLDLFKMILSYHLKLLHEREILINK